MDWITLTPAEVDNDALVPVCVQCGGRATARDNQDFEWHPDWVGWLFLAGIVPGIIAHAMYNKKMRAAMPVCDRHGPMTPWQVAGAAAGWLLLPALLAGATFGVCLLLRRSEVGGVLSDPALVTVTSISGGLGLLLWLAWLIQIRRGYRTIMVRSIDADGLSLVGLAEPFVRAMKEQRQVNAAAGRPSSTEITEVVRHPNS